MKPFPLLLLLAFICMPLPCGGAETRHTYDANGRITRVDYADGRAISYAYDPAGNVVRREFIVPGEEASRAASKPQAQKPSVAPMTVRTAPAGGVNPASETKPPRAARKKPSSARPAPRQ